MRNSLTVFFHCIMAATAMSQNIGVNTNTPTQPLDVVGNINTTGNLMVNGVAGANGQVLGMNGNTMQWMDKSRFKHWSVYPVSGSTAFSVPPGTTEVMIEMWGAGGGAHSIGGGGGSGGYWVGIIPVTGIASISLTIGNGANGSAGATAGGAGGNTSFSCTGFSVTAEGGGGADSTNSSGLRHHFSGNGGAGMLAGSIIPFGFRNYFFIDGNPGLPSTVTSVENTPGVFTDYTVYGVGGIAPYSGQRSLPATYETRTKDNVRVMSTYGTNSITGFGCGGTSRALIGGGGRAVDGGDGRIIIYY
jgi:hypothetical protein